MPPKTYISTYFIVAICLYSLNIFGQITLSFPTNRMVFQRNNENTGFINIMGNYSQNLDKIEARLLPIIAGQGTASNWSLVQENPKAGYFAGKIKGQGGWYKMEIRGVKDNVVLKTITLDKVGIGEVFIALGQSNAQGLPESGAKGATDDRVNTVNFFNDKGIVLENLSFVQLSQNVDIAPHGTGPWCYGELGDRLAKKLNVPVMFFNAGFLLVSVINWRESAEGIPTFNKVLDIGGAFQYNFGIPYVNLKNTLNYYGSLLGVRSLLWIQGETDNSPNRLSSEVYATNLQKLIDISRKDFDTNLTWMVARTSLTFQAPSNQEIIGGQNKVINKADNNVFAGPLTDILQVPRFDNVHFKNISPSNMGLSLLAENWDKFLDNTFFQNAKPVLARSIIEPEISCDADNKSVLKIADSFTNIEWSNGSKNSQIIVERGTYSVKIKDLQGNRLLSPAVNTNLIFPQEKPIITNDKNLEFCSDGTVKVELSANGQEFKTFLWSSGETSQRIVVDKTNDFTVKGKNQFGCVSLTSDKVSVKANPIPAPPKITVTPATNVCEGQNLTLSADSNEKLLWSNNATTKAIQIEKTGNYEFSVSATNIFDCVSASSLLQKVSISALPKQPFIAQIGLFSLQAQKSDLMPNDKFEWKKENVILPTSTLPSLRVSQSGSYKVSVNRTFQIPDNQQLTCQSKISEPFLFQVISNNFSIYPNPASSSVYLETKETVKNIDVKFYTLLGKQVYKFRLDDTFERKEIDLRSLEKGVYLVKIKGDGFEESVRLIIEPK